MNILIVEDEPDLLENLKTLLVSEQYTIEIAADGEDALKKVWCENQDLILLQTRTRHTPGLHTR